jgi:hypothetical protein
MTTDQLREHERLSCERPPHASTTRPTGSDPCPSRRPNSRAAYRAVELLYIGSELVRPAYDPLHDHLH